MDDTENELWSDHMEAIAQRRDKQAFAALFSGFAPRVKALMIRRGLSAPEAEEIVQETFAIVWRKAERFDRSKAAVPTWIFTIARNKQIDRHRKLSRPEPDPDDPAFAPDPDPLSDAVVSAKDEAARVRKAILQLPDEQRNAIIRSFYVGQAHSKIAESEVAPLGTVKSRIRLGLKRLKELLELEGDV